MPTIEVPSEPPTAPRKAEKAAPRRAPSPSGGLSKCAWLILTALAQLGTLTLEQAAITAGYSVKTGSVRNAAGELRAGGFVEGGNTTGLTATEKGRAEVRDVGPLPSGPDLLAFWNEKLARAEREILEQVLRVHPKSLDLATAAKRAGYGEKTGSVRNAAGRLRTLGLVTGGNAGMTANERLV